MKNEETARRLQAVLDEFNMRAQDLVEKSGVSKASVSQYLSGSHAPSNISAGKIGKALNVNPLWLMGFNVGREMEITEISVEEMAVMTAFRKLNAEGQQKVADYIADLINSGRYKKHDQLDMVEEA